MRLEFVQTLPFRGRRSRNKVSVGEPAEGSLTHCPFDGKCENIAFIIQTTLENELKSHQPFLI